MLPLENLARKGLINEVITIEAKINAKQTINCARYQWDDSQKLTGNDVSDLMTSSNPVGPIIGVKAFL